MPKKFLNKILSVFLMLSLALTFSFIGSSTKAYATNTFGKNTPEEKIFIKDKNGLTSDNNYVTFRAIPDNWDPTKATDEELEYYKFPKRPKDSTQLDIWKKIASCKFIKPEFVKTNVLHTSLKKTITTDAAVNVNNIYNDSYSSNWAGIVRDQQATEIQGYWSVPLVSASSGQVLPEYASQWVGLGGTNETDLIQAGTATYINDNGSAVYIPWYEIYGIDSSIGSQNEMDISNLPCKPGDIVNFEVRIDNSKKCTFLIANLTTSKATMYTATTNNYTDPTSAEWIVERPTIITDIGNIMYPYPKTIDKNTSKQTVRFDLCSNNNSSSNGISYNKSNLYNLTMLEGSTTIAQPITPGTLAISLGGTTPPICVNSFNGNYVNSGTMHQVN